MTRNLSTSITQRNLGLELGLGTAGSDYLGLELVSELVLCIAGSELRIGDLGSGNCNRIAGVKLYLGPWLWL